MRIVALALLCVASCSEPTLPKPVARPVAVEPAPLGQLPSDVRPLRYRIELTLDPRAEGFTGTVEIDIALAEPRAGIWLHGLLDTVEASVLRGGETIAARAEVQRPAGVLAVTPARALPSGEATLRLHFASHYGKNLVGLFRVTAGGDRYVFTQMEPIWARQALPCFDEPRFKTPWEVTLRAPKGDRAIANTRELERHDEGEHTVIRFAPTEPLPSYLLAWAVGPLDVVEHAPVPPNEVRAHPLPLRGITARGRGGEIGYALDGTGELLTSLEGYFGVPYPYDKLDILAVPDKEGAMENAGAVTFRDWLVLVDEARSPANQKRAYAYVMAHELAHQWFGNLVTMPWWDDVWLNEAFATWMGFRTVQRWRPEHDAAASELRGVHEAMRSDSLTSARRIRQPIDGIDDIHAAFDSITYRKGGGVLAMSERWLGEETFRAGLQRYVRAHAGGNATSEDLFVALSQASGKDVSGVMTTFVSQPGLPFVAARLDCAGGDVPRLHLEQSRYLPLGSQGKRDQTWRIPVCVRFDGGEQCLLLGDKRGQIDLGASGTCPRWVMPNAGAAGYYRWSLPAEDLAALVAARDALDVRERMSAAEAVMAAFDMGTLSGRDALAIVAPLARDPHPDVATAPARILRQAWWWLYDDARARAALEAYGRELYLPVFQELGWDARPRDPVERTLLRAELVRFLGLVARDPGVGAEAERRVRQYLGLGGDGPLHRDALAPDLVDAAFAVAGSRSDPALFDAMLARLRKSEDAELRANLITGLSSAEGELGMRAIALSLSTDLRVSEAITPLRWQMGKPGTRDGAWQWLREHLTALMLHLPPRRAGWLPDLAAAFCERGRLSEIELTFEPRLSELAGGERSLASALETVTICAERRKAQRDSLRSALVATEPSAPLKP